LHAAAPPGIMRHDRRAHHGAQEEPMETIVGIALVVISALEILWIVRIVSANLPRA
jgi:hypothetical protein